jgi:hypothetical protein
MTQLFVDLDGVLADFDTGYERAFGIRPSKAADNVDWSLVRKRDGFYTDLPPMPDFDELWGFVDQLVRKPIILTGVPAGVPEAPENKHAWVRRHIGAHVEVRCCRSSEKSLHASPGDILVDDWTKYQDLWIEAGGLWITHRSARETIDALLEMGIGL